MELATHRGNTFHKARLLCSRHRLRQEFRKQTLEIDPDGKRVKFIAGGANFKYHGRFGNDEA
jgi:hypothetical protein